MSTWKRIAVAVVMCISVAGLVSPQHARSEEKKNGKMVDLNSFVCKDLMRASGEDRDIGLALLQGYFLGKSGKTIYNRETVSNITDQFIEYCLDHPTTKVLDAMGQFAK